MEYGEIKKLISFIYDKENPEVVSDLIIGEMEKAALEIKAPGWYLTDCSLPADEKDAVLITYGDQFRKENCTEETALATLGRFLDRYIGNAISTIHILPFSPYSSDDGFSVIDYREVNPEWGSWDDIKQIGKNYKLMADIVLNHCSAESEWFKKFLDLDEKYKDFFITVEPDTDLSMVFRPRALPLLTPFNTKEGEKLVWTTFSADQVDLNYENPQVLNEMLSIFFMYVKNGISIIRLDAIAYLWKENNHSCLHHEKTHAVVKLFREAAKLVAPWVIIITETNVPHKENLSYFGSGTDEAHMVYQFALPPLVLDGFIKEDASYLQKWARESLEKPPSGVTFFNFLASHDGVGVLPARGILPEERIEDMISAVSSEERGALISWKAVKDGKVPYEINVSYRSAIAGKEAESREGINKFLAAQALMLAMEGIPGIYIHSILGSLNYREGVNITGMNRTINREKFIFEKLEKELDNKASSRAVILKKYKELLNVRKKEKAFNPLSKQIVLPTSGSLFAFSRFSGDFSQDDKMDNETVLCLYNISGKTYKSFPKWDIFPAASGKFHNIITDSESDAVIISGSSVVVTLESWEFVWLKIKE